MTILILATLFCMFVAIASFIFCGVSSESSDRQDQHGVVPLFLFGLLFISLAVYGYGNKYSEIYAKEQTEFFAIKHGIGEYYIDKDNEKQFRLLLKDIKKEEKENE